MSDKTKETADNNLTFLYHRTPDSTEDQLNIIDRTRTCAFYVVSERAGKSDKSAYHS